MRVETALLIATASAPWLIDDAVSVSRGDTTFPVPIA